MLSQYLWAKLADIVIAKLVVVTVVLVLVLVIDRLFTFVIQDYVFNLREKIKCSIRQNLKWLRS
ncbi:MAG: hypothetical protein LRY71_15270 [Bacillaceae bacterium]|nr:hypothetical protein [Bacillaceae bacterium]